MHVKGLSSFVRQSIYLVALFFFLGIVAGAIGSFSASVYKSGGKSMTYEKGMDLMDAMVQKCFNGAIEQDKIEYYQANPEELRKCMKSYEFPYWVQFKIRNSTWKGKPGSSQAAKKRLLVLIIDTSGSMSDRIGSRTKMEIARDGISEFIDSCTTDKDKYSLIT